MVSSHQEVLQVIPPLQYAKDASRFQHLSQAWQHIHLILVKSRILINKISFFYEESNLTSLHLEKNRSIMTHTMCMCRNM